MKLRDETFKRLSSASYDNNTETVATPHDGKFKVIEKRDNEENGLRAYAYAPDVNGKPDTSKIIISYAGTDITKLNDIVTDATININDKHINEKYKNLKNTNISKRNSLLYKEGSDYKLKEPDFGFPNPHDYPNQFTESNTFTKSVKEKYA